MPWIARIIKPAMIQAGASVSSRKLARDARSASRRLEEDVKANDSQITFVNIILLLGLSLVISAFGQNFGTMLNGATGASVSSRKLARDARSATTE